MDSESLSFIAALALAAYNAGGFLVAHFEKAEATAAELAELKARLAAAEANAPGLTTAPAVVEAS